MKVEGFRNTVRTVHARRCSAAAAAAASVMGAFQKRTARAQLSDATPWLDYLRG